MQRYHLHKVVGSGAYGKVYRATEKETSQEVAVKCIRNDLVTEGEIIYMQTIPKHENIIEVREHLLSPSQFFLVMEYMHCSLYSWLKLHKKQPPRVKKLTEDLFKAVAFCHLHKIVHRDLKPSNCLLDNEATILKICDFGLATNFGREENTPRACTLQYRAPEMIMGSTDYTEHVDVWAAGCTVMEMLSQEIAFDCKTEIELMLCIFEALGTPSWEGVEKYQDYNVSFPKWPKRPASTLLKDEDQWAGRLLDGAMQVNPAQRISAAEAVQCLAEE